MSFFSRFGRSDPKPSAPPQPPAQSAISQPLRLPIGPSPWAFYNRTFTIQGVTYHFQEATQNKQLAGMVSLQDSAGTTLLLLDFCCYMRLLDDGTVLLWCQPTPKCIIFNCFNLSSLAPISDVETTAANVRTNKLGTSPLRSTQHWEFPSQIPAGVQSFSIPHDWTRFEETLVLGDSGDSNHFDKMTRAIYAFDWRLNRVEVFPQDWFNEGDYDFGYQWITRVARCADGSIVGDGIRLGRFELDATNRRVKKWLTTDPFYQIQ